MSASVSERLRHAADTVASCERQPVDEAKKAFADATREVIAARNELIDGDREDARLAKINALLSLMASVEFPLGGFHRERFGATVKAIRAAADAP